MRHADDPHGIMETDGDARHQIVQHQEYRM
jgi:hypothetical protein